MTAQARVFATQSTIGGFLFMPLFSGRFFRILPLAGFLCASMAASAAQGGNAAPVRGTVTDPSGAVIPGATVRLSNTISGLNRTATTDATGQFEIANIPFNNYSVAVSAPGFSALKQNIVLRSAVGITVELVLKIEGAASTVTVEANAGDLVETDPASSTAWETTPQTRFPSTASPSPTSRARSSPTNSHQILFSPLK
jgi:hypothetical protein